MRTVQIKVSETDFQKYKLKSEIKFTELVDLISREYARKALLECNEIAQQVGLSKMTMDEINAEIVLTNTRNINILQHHKKD